MKLKNLLVGLLVGGVLVLLDAEDLRAEGPQIQPPENVDKLQRGVGHLLRKMSSMLDNPEIQTLGTGAIWKLSQDRQTRDALPAMGVVGGIMQAMEAHEDNQAVIGNACAALAILSEIPAVKQDILHSPGIEHLLKALKQSATAHNKHSARILEDVLGTLANLSLMKGDARTLGLLGVPERILQVMRERGFDRQVQLYGCIALRNLVRAAENRKELAAHGVVDSVAAILRGFAEDGAIQEAGLGLLLGMELDIELMALDEVEDGVAGLAVDAMDAHQDRAGVAENGCKVFLGLGMARERKKGDTWVSQQLRDSQDGNFGGLLHAMREGGLSAVDLAIRSFSQHVGVQKHCRLLAAQEWFRQVRKLESKESDVLAEETASSGAQAPENPLHSESLEDVLMENGIPDSSSNLLKEDLIHEANEAVNDQSSPFLHPVEFEIMEADESESSTYQDLQQEVRTKIRKTLQVMSQSLQDRNIQLEGCLGLIEAASTISLSDAELDVAAGDDLTENLQLSYDPVVEAMQTHEADFQLQEYCIMAIWQTGRAIPSSLVHWINIGTISTIVEALQRHKIEAGIQDFGSRALADLGQDEIGHAQILRWNGVSVVISAMDYHSMDPDIVEQGCRFLTMMSINEDGANSVVEEGGLNAAISATSATSSDARMREQGCHVLLALCHAGVNLAEHAKVLGFITRSMSLHSQDSGLREVGSAIVLCMASDVQQKPKLYGIQVVKQLVEAFKNSGFRDVSHRIAADALESLSQTEDGRDEVMAADGVDVFMKDLGEINKRDMFLVDMGDGRALGQITCKLLWIMSRDNSTILTHEYAKSCFWSCHTREELGDISSAKGFGRKAATKSESKGIFAWGCEIKLSMLKTNVGKIIVEGWDEERWGFSLETILSAIPILLSMVPGVLLLAYRVILWRHRRQAAAALMDNLQPVGPNSLSPALGRVGSRANSLQGSQKRLVHPFEIGRPKLTVVFLDEIKHVSGDFSEARKIGGGGFGSVYRVEWIPGIGDDQPVAIKRLDPEGLQGQGEFLQEVQVLGSCQHPNILPLLGFSAEKSATVCLITPLMNGGSFEDRLLLEPSSIRRLRFLGCPAMANGKISPLTWRERVHVLIGATRAIAYLHAADPSSFKPQILHRDVKAANILLDSELNGRVCDAGLSRVSRDLQPQGPNSHMSSARLVGTQGFVDPVYQATGRMDASTDGYGLGVTFMMALTGWAALDHSSPEPLLLARCHEVLFGDKQAISVAQESAGWTERASADLVDVARKLLHPVRKNRITVSRAKELLEETFPDEAALRPGEAIRLINSRANSRAASLKSSPREHYISEAEALSANTQDPLRLAEDVPANMLGGQNGPPPGEEEGPGRSKRPDQGEEAGAEPRPLNPGAEPRPLNPTTNGRLGTEKPRNLKKGRAKGNGAAHEGGLGPAGTGGAGGRGARRVSGAEGARGHGPAGFVGQGSEGARNQGAEAARGQGAEGARSNGVVLSKGQVAEGGRSQGAVGSIEQGGEGSRGRRAEGTGGQGAEEGKEKKECQWCMERPRQVRFTGCGHAILCVPCYQELVSKPGAQCPYCQAPVSSRAEPSDLVAVEATFVTPKPTAEGQRR